MIVQDVVVLREAADDLETGYVFYEKREKGVGDYFYDNLIADIESLIIFAGIHTLVERLYRMLSKRFPYAIYYQISDQMDYVVAILPMKRDPVWIITACDPGLSPEKRDHGFKKRKKQ